MGRDFRYCIFSNDHLSTGSDSDYDSQFDHDASSWQSINRYNNYIHGGVYTYRQLLERIRELTATLTDLAGLDDGDPDATIDNANHSEIEDVAEAIFVYSRLLKEIGPTLRVRIRYD